MAEAQTPDLEGMLKSVLDDPAKMEQLRTIMGTLGSTGGGADSETDGSSPSVPVGGLLSGLLSNPAVLSQLPAMMEMLRPMMNGGAAASAVPASADPGDGKDGGDDGESKPAGAHPVPRRRSPDHRTALLLALKPYLNDGRREMIDYIVNLSRLGDILNR